MCGVLAVCLHHLRICEMCSHVCIKKGKKKKVKGNMEGRWWWGVSGVGLSVSLQTLRTASCPLIRLSTKPSRTTARRRDTSRIERRSPAKEGRGCFSGGGQVEAFRCEAALFPFGQGELKEPLSSKSSMTFISRGDGGA